MDPELDVVRQINKLAGQARPVDLMMDLITCYGHWAFLIYGMLLWFAPGKNQKHRRESCVAAFLAVCLCSVISLAVGEVIELHLCGVLAEEFNVYLVPRVVVGGSRICEE